MNSEDQARRYVHLAIMIGLIAPSFEYLRFLVLFPGTLFYETVAVMGFTALAVCGTLAWFLAMPLLRVASSILYLTFGRGVPYERWTDAAYRALWRLPIAAALGVVTWLVYSLGKFGGWPDDVIFGAIANLLGAWCYGTIFWNWFQLRRKPCSADDVATSRV